MELFSVWVKIRESANMSAEADDVETPVVVSDLPTAVLTEELISDYVEYLKIDSSQEVWIIKSQYLFQWLNSNSFK